MPTPAGTPRAAPSTNSARCAVPLVDVEAGVLLVDVEVAELLVDVEAGVSQVMPPTGLPVAAVSSDASGDGTGVAAGLGLGGGDVAVWPRVSRTTSTIATAAATTAAMAGQNRRHRDTPVAPWRRAWRRLSRLRRDADCGGRRSGVAGRRSRPVLRC